ncbi:lipoyl(octanoyl) transferase [Malassezia nana]|uniref:Lipoyl(Octanoyl) transferase n=1 Tax=Malassezia nana TaxID=180528 RepID=A0AAF0EIZ4_9BASI|nr:lipoyl(octanoyl) transferase [Malassezia nana]
MAAAVGAQRVVRAARLLRPGALPTFTSPSLSLRSHVIVCLAYLAQLHPTAPEPVAKMAHLTRALLAHHRWARASQVLCELAQAPSHRFCAPDDAILLDTLRHGIRCLGRRAPLSWVSDHETPAHPALTLATLYDHCTEAGIALPCDALSSLIATLARTIDRSALVPMLDVLAADFVERAPAPYTPSVLAALVHAYGRADAPQQGEKMLARYALRHGASTTARAVAQQYDPPHLAWQRRYTSVQHIPHDVPLHAVWTQHPDVWNALIRARVLAGHVVSARVWLERFRLLTRLRHIESLHAVAGPKPTASPYLTLMHGLSTSSALRQLFAHLSPAAQASLHAQATNMDAPFKSAAIYEILSLVQRDRVTPGVAMLNLLASFETGCGRLSRAAALASEACRLENGPANVIGRTRGAATSDVRAYRGHRIHISTIPVLFLLCAAHARHAYGQQPAHMDRLTCEVWPVSHPLSSLATSPRAVLRTCTELVQSRSAAVAPYLRTRGTALLNAALDAMLATNDWQGAWYVLQLYERWELEPDAWTQLMLWRRLSALPHASQPAASHARGVHALQHAGMVLERVLQEQGLPLPSIEMVLAD